MKKANKIETGELRPEYKRSDFGPMERGKYSARVKANSNVVVIDDELREAFPNADAVNSALRALAEIARRTPPKRRKRA